LQNAGLSYKKAFSNPDKTMKIRLLVAIVGLVIGVALPALAQQTSTPDPQIRERLIAAIKKHTDSLDKNDAAAVAANFTEDGILVTPDGSIFGRDSIEKYYEGVFKQIQLSDNLAPVDDDSPHIFGKAPDRRSKCRWPPPGYLHLNCHSVCAQRQTARSEQTCRQNHKQGPKCDRGTVPVFRQVAGLWNLA
jgi:hypothetical protein